jgi:membrane-bound ClpP family serine protease
VFVHGELWRATAAGGPLPAGTRVKVVRVRDLTVDVVPVDRAD